MERVTADFSGYRFCRYFVAFWMFGYGFAKIFRSQFTSLLHELDTPFGEMSGIAMVWGFFGYSDGYRLFIAAAEIGGAALLLHRRTVPLGALLLSGMLVNIILLDIFYLIGALPMSLLLLGMTSYLLSVHRAPLRAALVLAPSPPAAEPRSRVWTRYGARAAVLGGAILLAYWVKYYVKTVPTPLDGRWRMESIAAKGPPAPATMLDSATTLYFEPEFGFMAVMRTPGGFRQGRFDVDAERGHLRIRETYSRTGRILFDGRYELRGSRLRLEDARHTILLSLWPRQAVR